MRERELSVAALARATGLNRSTLTALVHQRATRIELPAIERLCEVLQCQVGDLLQLERRDAGAGA
ncbi:helix-turn-helix domain-containing protein [Azohydromonas australica]|uniref:helix-turn-helix domain-containing protein n=1 Tax=Azohydromonas australica TaxID=364039 RepID=UPI001B7FD032|nr:helix-turn-helix transcriptional regulator [Azohydromonas australica]